MDEKKLNWIKKKVFKDCKGLIHNYFGYEINDVVFNLEDGKILVYFLQDDNQKQIVIKDMKDYEKEYLDFGFDECTVEKYKMECYACDEVDDIENNFISDLETYVKKEKKKKKKKKKLIKLINLMVMMKKN